MSSSLLWIYIYASTLLFNFIWLPPRASISTTLNVPHNAPKLTNLICRTRFLCKLQDKWIFNLLWKQLKSTWIPIALLDAAPIFQPQESTCCTYISASRNNMVAPIFQHHESTCCTYISNSGIHMVAPIFNLRNPHGCTYISTSGINMLHLYFNLRNLHGCTYISKAEINILHLYSNIINNK